MSKGAYHVDTIFLLQRAEETLQTGQLQYLLGFGRPLTVLLGAIFIGIFGIVSPGDPVFAVNFMSVLFGALSVPLSYLIAKKLLDETTALFAALFLTALPLFLALSSYGNSHAPNIFFILSSLFLLLSYQGRKAVPTLIFSSILLASAAATRLQELVIMFIPFCYVLWNFTERDRFFRNLFLFWGATVVFTAAYHLPLFMGEGAGEFYFRHLSYFVSDGLKTNYKGILSENMLTAYWIMQFNLSIIGVITVLLGFAVMAARHRRTFFLLLLWTLIPLFFYGNIKTLAPRYFMIAYLPMTVALGFLYSYCLKTLPKFRYILICVFAANLFFSAFKIGPVLLKRHNADVWKNFSEWVAAQTPDNAVVIAADDGPFIQYYGKRDFMYQLASLRSTIADERLEKYRADIDDLLNEGRRVFITSAGLTANNPDDAFKNFVENHYSLELLGMKTIEDFHLGETYTVLFKNGLFELTFKDRVSANTGTQ